MTHYPTLPHKYSDFHHYHNSLQCFGICLSVSFFIFPVVFFTLSEFHYLNLIHNLGLYTSNARLNNLVTTVITIQVVLVRVKDSQC